MNHLPMIFSQTVYVLYPTLFLTTKTTKTSEICMECDIPHFASLRRSTPICNCAHAAPRHTSPDSPARFPSHVTRCQKPLPDSSARSPSDVTRRQKRLSANFPPRFPDPIALKTNHQPFLLRRSLLLPVSSGKSSSWKGTRGENADTPGFPSRKSARGFSEGPARVSRRFRPRAAPNFPGISGEIGTRNAVCR